MKGRVLTSKKEIAELEKESQAQQQNKEILEYCRKNKVYTAEFLIPRFSSKSS